MSDLRYTLAVEPDRGALNTVRKLCQDWGIRLKQPAPTYELVERLVTGMERTDVDFPNATDYMRNDGRLRIGERTFDIGCFVLDAKFKKEFESFFRHLLGDGGSWIVDEIS